MRRKGGFGVVGKISLWWNLLLLGLKKDELGLKAIFFAARTLD